MVNGTPIPSPGHHKLSIAGPQIHISDRAKMKILSRGQPIIGLADYQH